MIYTPMTRKAMRVAYEAHKGQMDESGVPYIFHPYHVAEQMTDEISVCVAVLHDVLEDTDVTSEKLEAQFPEEVMEPLRLLRHEHGEDYMVYINRIKCNPVAVQVKLADIAHNSDETRVYGTGVTQERLEHWRAKYRKAKRVLEEGQE